MAESTDTQKPEEAPKPEAAKKAKTEQTKKPAASGKKPAASGKKPAASGKKPAAKKASSGSVAGGGQIRLKDRYRDVIAPELQKEFGFQSPMQIPKIDKIIVSAGVGEAIGNKKLLDSVISEIELITGQKAVCTRARKSIANFKVRSGMEVGAKVTLRGARMYEFLDRFVNIALPRIKDFRGINPKSFDGRGNYSLGIDEQIIFPEIDYDKIEKVRGLNVAIVTTAPTDEQAHSLLAKFGMPFRKE